LNLAEKKSYLARWAITRALKEKYGLRFDTAEENLAVKFVIDKDFNKIGLSRINKINELLKGGSGIEPFGKYADEYNDGAYYSRSSALEKFGSAALELSAGRISEIIPRIDGYYILERIGGGNGQIGLKYLFINAQKLDQYIAEAIGKTKVFILAD